METEKDRTVAGLLALLWGSQILVFMMFAGALFFASTNLAPDCRGAETPKTKAAHETDQRYRDPFGGVVVIVDRGPNGDGANGAQDQGGDADHAAFEDQCVPGSALPIRQQAFDQLIRLRRDRLDDRLPIDRLAFFGFGHVSSLKAGRVAPGGAHV